MRKGQQAHTLRRTISTITVAKEKEKIQIESMEEKGREERKAIVALLVSILATLKMSEK